MKTVIIGAGPAGLTAAYQLSKETPDVVVYEAADCVGGLARSIELWGQRVDLGPHRFFSHDRRVNELWLEVVGRDYYMVNRQTRILYQDKLFQYPLEAFDALAKLGPVEAARCVASYARQLAGRDFHVSGNPSRHRNGAGDAPPRAPADRQVSPTNSGGSFEDWVCGRFGRRLFEIFFKTYSEKLWGIPCNELDADFAAQRIKKFSLSAALKGAVLPGQRKQHRTLADEFAYPVGGTGAVYERMAEAIRRRGGKVHLNSPVKRVLTEEVTLTPALSHQMGEGAPESDRVSKVVGIELMSGEKVACDHVISTMPLTALVKQLADAPAEVLEACRQLRFRNTILVYLEILNDNPFPDQWIYVHSPELRFGRVTNFRNWVSRRAVASKVSGRGDLPVGSDARQAPSGGPPGGAGGPPALPAAILAMEYWCDAEDDLWRWDDGRLSALAREEILMSRLVANSDQLGRGFVFRIPKCYPVYRRGYQAPLQVIREYLRGISGLQVIGRYGAFKYNNQDHSILMGRLAAENVLEGTRHDLWGVNTDYEVYQEECSITEAGLARAAERNGAVLTGHEVQAMAR